MKGLLRISLLLLTILCSVAGFSQQLWKESPDKYAGYFEANKSAKIPQEYRLFTLDVATLQRMQPSIPLMQDDQKVKGLPFQFPMPDGTVFTTNIVESPIWNDRSVSDNINLKTYLLINPTTNAMNGRLTIWNNSISGIFFAEEGTVYIHPLNVDQSNMHLVYYTKDVTGTEGAVPCHVEDNGSGPESINSIMRTSAGDCRRRTYRLAVAATGEYTAWAGSVANAIGYISITMNNVSAVYHRDLNVVFTLVGGTDIIFQGTTTDPYTNNGANTTTLNENQNVVNFAVGAANYDLSIVLTRGSGGGLAMLNSVCDAGNKAKAAMSDNSGTGANPAPGPQGQWFDVGVAHELGHMFGAGHTFSANNGQCGTNIRLASAWEPGGGSTVMAYAAACPGNYYQPLQEFYFHAGSIAQMQNLITGSWGSCAAVSTTSNQAPVATVPSFAYSIPASTPFVLTMDAMDGNNDPMVYSWEQLDANFASGTAPNPSNIQGPMFRSYAPSASPSRYFPRLQSILGGSTSTQWEVLPIVTRNMNFRGTVRDQSPLGGCTAEANVALSVVGNAGPFYITSQWGATTWTGNGTNTASITWDIANTNVAPINATHVNILFSTDGGYTYPIVLAQNTPNDGQQDILIPSINTTTGRIMIIPTNNVFFDINDAPVTIQSTLPVTFLDFTAQKKEGNVWLEWSTGTEQNSAYFEVERSANGAVFNTVVGKVTAAGNSTSLQRYNLLDNAPLEGTNYYRIKQFDKDGSYTYSKTVMINFAGGITLSVYPNPAREVMTVDIRSIRSGKATLSIINSKGATALQQNVQVVAGRNVHSLNVGQLAPGVYVLRTIDADGVVNHSRFIKE